MQQATDQSPLEKTEPIAPVSPPQKPKSKLPVLSAILLIVGLLVGGGYYLGLQQKEQTVLVNAIPSSVTQTSTDQTANWKTFSGETGYTTDGSTRFTIKYPSEWAIEGNLLYPFGKQEDKGLETRIILGAAGHGWPEEKIIQKDFFAGTANYSWINDGAIISAFASFENNGQVYIIEIQNLASQYEDEYKAIFDQILSTFRFTDQTSMGSSTTMVTFTGEKYNYSFSYPSYFTVERNPYGDTIPNKEDAKFVSTTDSIINSIEFRAVSGYWADQSKTSSAEVNGHTFWYGVSPEYNNNEGLVTVMAQTGKEVIYEFSFHGTHDFNDPTIQQMLRTFTFAN